MAAPKENTNTYLPTDSEGAEVSEGRRRLLLWLWRVPVLAVFAGIAWAALRLYQVIFLRAPAPLHARYHAIEPVAIVAERTLAAQWQQGSWQSLEFTIAGTPAIMVHSPQPIAGGLESSGMHLIAFSRICTHQGCPVTLNREINAIAAAYNYRPKAPSLVCPCHYSVFSVLEAGAAKSGPAHAPLPRVQLESRAGIITAIGLESHH